MTQSGFELVVRRLGLGLKLVLKFVKVFVSKIELGCWVCLPTAFVDGI